MSALSTVRGNAKVTSDSPEDTYDVLKKYGADLVELARNQQLDPVIGRDEEIRNVIRILSRKTKNNPVLIQDRSLKEKERNKLFQVCPLYDENTPLS